MRPLRSLLLPAAVALPALLVGCGDGGGGGAAADDPYVVAARDAMVADDAFPGTDEEAQCIAEQFVGAIGSDTLEEAGVTPEQLGADDFDPLSIGIDVDEDTAREIVGSFGDCGMSIVDLIVGGMAAGGEVSDELRTCVEENLDEDTFTDIIVQSMAAGASTEEPPAEFLSAIFGLMSACPDLAGGEGG